MPGDGCEFKCGVGSVVKRDITFELGKGSGVTFEVQPDKCLAVCEVGATGMFGPSHSSCEVILPGSAKVSKNGSTKLCCTTMACNLDDDFSCQAGQGLDGTFYRATDDNSFMSCAAICDLDKECHAFDYSAEAQFPGLKYTPRCRLYRAEAITQSRYPPRADPGRFNYRYCQNIKRTLYHEFSCQAGQGLDGTFYKATDDNSFMSCAAICDFDKECHAFDYSAAAKFPGLNYIPRCHLYKAEAITQSGYPPRADPGLLKYRYCKKNTADTQDAVDQDDANREDAHSSEAIN